MKVLVKGYLDNQSPESTIFKFLAVLIFDIWRDLKKHVEHNRKSNLELKVVLNPEECSKIVEKLVQVVTRCNQKCFSVEKSQTL